MPGLDFVCLVWLEEDNSSLHQVIGVDMAGGVCLAYLNLVVIPWVELTVAC